MLISKTYSLANFIAPISYTSVFLQCMLKGEIDEDIRYIKVLTITIRGELSEFAHKSLPHRIRMAKKCSKNFRCLLISKKTGENFFHFRTLELDMWFERDNSNILRDHKIWPIVLTQVYASDFSKAKQTMSICLFESIVYLKFAIGRS